MKYLNSLSELEPAILAAIPKISSPPQSKQKLRFEALGPAKNRFTTAQWVIDDLTSAGFVVNEANARNAISGLIRKNQIFVSGKVLMPKNQRFSSPYRKMLVR